jgi:hypothetical protein
MKQLYLAQLYHIPHEKSQPFRGLGAGNLRAGRLDDRARRDSSRRYVDRPSNRSGGMSAAESLLERHTSSLFGHSFLLDTSTNAD